jgi:hypothetical protein
MAPPPSPTLAGFLVFIREGMGISSTILPDNDPSIPLAFAVALAIVNPALQAMPIPSSDAAGVSLNSGGLTIYTFAVYNFAADRIINFAQDQPNAEPVKGSGDPGLPFFQWQRKELNINGFVPGVIQSSNDETTGESFVVQEAAKQFTLMNIQQLKTLWGRQYLSLAQSFGPTTWGLS